MSSCVTSSCENKPELNSGIVKLNQVNSGLSLTAEEFNTKEAFDCSSLNDALIPVPHHECDWNSVQSNVTC